MLTSSLLARKEATKKKLEQTSTMDQLTKAMATMTKQMIQQQQQMTQQMVKQQAENQHLPEILAKTNNKPEAPIKMAPYIDGKDIDTFLDTFEATMRIHGVDEDEWVKRLIMLLQGKAREASQYINYDTDDYRHVKEALRKHFRVTEDSQRMKFREHRWTQQSTPEKYCGETHKLAVTVVTTGTWKRTDVEQN